MRGALEKRWLLSCAMVGVAAVFFAVSASALDPARALSEYLHESWRTEKGLPGESITAVAQTSDGYLWIGTDKGLVRFDGLNFHQFERAQPDSIPIGIGCGMKTWPFEKKSTRRRCSKRLSGPLED